MMYYLVLSSLILNRSGLSLLDAYRVVCVCLSGANLELMFKIFNFKSKCSHTHNGDSSDGQSSQTDITYCGNPLDKLCKPLAMDSAPESAKPNFL